MPLVFAGITPHPPLLIPMIGKNQIKKIAKTQAALRQMEAELYATRPQIIIIISPHSGLFANSFTLNAHTDFVSNFEEFGDFSTQKQWPGAPSLAAQINDLCQRKDIPLQMVSEQKLDHGAAVPLFYLTEHLKDVKILPIGYSKLNAVSHFHFGGALKEIIMSAKERIAVIATGDLTHGLPKSKTVKETFDAKLIHCLRHKIFGNLMELDGSYLQTKANECGFRSILILLGVMKEIDYSFKDYVYEHPFGVGYLTGSFDF